MNSTFLQKYRLLFLGGCLTVIVFLFLFFLLNNRQKDTTLFPSNLSQKPTITPFPTSGVLSIVDASPFPDSTNVAPEEILISVTTNIPVYSKEEVSLSVFPLIQSRLETTFPTNTVQLRVLGGLENNTKYTVTVKNKNGVNIYAWAFTTGIRTQGSSTKLQQEIEKGYFEEYLPLFYKVPYETTNFSLDYTKQLTLEVHIKSGSQKEVQKEVEAWIRSQGVDPATHTIIYK